eukprot:403366883
MSLQSSLDSKDHQNNSKRLSLAHGSKELNNESKQYFSSKTTNLSTNYQQNRMSSASQRSSHLNSIKKRKLGSLNGDIQEFIVSRKGSQANSESQNQIDGEYYNSNINGDNQPTNFTNTSKFNNQFQNQQPGQGKQKTQSQTSKINKISRSNFNSSRNSGSSTSKNNRKPDLMETLVNKLPNPNITKYSFNHDNFQVKQTLNQSENLKTQKPKSNLLYPLKQHYNDFLNNNLDKSNEMSSKRQAFILNSKEQIKKISNSSLDRKTNATTNISFKSDTSNSNQSRSNSIVNNYYSGTKPAQSQLSINYKKKHYNYQQPVKFPTDRKYSGDHTPSWHCSKNNSNDEIQYQINDILSGIIESNNLKNQLKEQLQLFQQDFQTLKLNQSPTNNNVSNYNNITVTQNFGGNQHNSTGAIINTNSNLENQRNNSLRQSEQHLRRNSEETNTDEFNSQTRLHRETINMQVVLSSEGMLDSNGSEPNFKPQEYYQTVCEGQLNNNNSNSRDQNSLLTFQKYATVGGLGAQSCESQPNIRTQALNSDKFSSYQGFGEDNIPVFMTISHNMEFAEAISKYQKYSNHSLKQSQADISVKLRKPKHTKSRMSHGIYDYKYHKSQQQQHNLYQNDDIVVVEEMSDYYGHLGKTMKENFSFNNKNNQDGPDEFNESFGLPFITKTYRSSSNNGGGMHSSGSYQNTSSKNSQQTLKDQPTTIEMCRQSVYITQNKKKKLEFSRSSKQSTFITNGGDKENINFNTIYNNTNSVYNSYATNVSNNIYQPSNNLKILIDENEEEDFEDINEMSQASSDIQIVKKEIKREVSMVILDSESDEQGWMNRMGCCRNSYFCGIN